MSKRLNNKITTAVDYQRSVISDGTNLYSVSSYEDFTVNKRRFAVYDRQGKRVDPELEKKLIEAKIENPLFIAREN